MIKKIKYYLYLIKFLFNKKNFILKSKSQNDNLESEFLQKIINKINNKSFLEIGFSPFEFNNIHLMIKNFKGHLVDCNIKNVIFMKLLNFFHNYSVKISNIFLNEKNIISILKSSYGIFSIDIDGNDYWLTKKVLENNVDFEVFIVEYNSTFLDKTITVPYDCNFNRHEKHASGWYHGASLNAFIKLFAKRNYALVKTIGGVNAFFVKKSSLFSLNLKEINFREAFQENLLRSKWSKKNAQQQFDVIKNLKFIEVN
jgi:hypothetical protein